MTVVNSSFIKTFNALRNIHEDTPDLQWDDDLTMVFYYYKYCLNVIKFSKLPLDTKMNVCSSMLKCSFKINRSRDLKQKGLFVFRHSVTIKMSYEMPIICSFTCHMKCNLNISRTYLDIIFESYVTLVTKLSVTEV